MPKSERSRANKTILLEVCHCDEQAQLHISDIIQRFRETHHCRVTLVQTVNPGERHDDSAIRRQWSNLQSLAAKLRALGADVEFRLRQGRPRSAVELRLADFASHLAPLRAEAGRREAA